MKKHNAFKVVLIALIVFMILSWVIPAAYYSGELVNQGRVQMGLFNLFDYPLTALSYFGYIAFYFILVGGFYGILHKIPAYRNFLDKIVALFDGKEKVFISLVMIILAVLVSVCGVQYEIFLFFPFIIALILLMGYDKIVAAITLVGATSVGLAGGTYAYNNLSVLLSSLSLKLDYEIGVRAVILLVGLVLLIFNVILYINKIGKNVSAKTEVKKVSLKEEVKEEKIEVKEEKVEKTTKKSSASKSSSKKSTGKGTSKKSTGKKTTSKSKSSKKDLKAAVKDEDIIVVKGDNASSFIPSLAGKSHKVWPLVVLSVIVFVIFVLAFIPWNENALNVALFSDVTKSVVDFKLFGFQLFGKILGTDKAFGSWTMTEMYVVMALVVLILSIIYKVKFNDVLDGFAEGAKKALAPAGIVIIAYTILVTVTYHPFQTTVYSWICGGLGKASPVLVALGSCLTAIFATIFNVDVSYVFQSSLPYVTSVVTNKEVYGLIGIVFQSIYGLTALVAPTSVILLAVLSALNISYKEWLCKIWKFLVEFLVILLIIFVILALV